MKTIKRTLALILTLTLCLAALPGVTLAADAPGLDTASPWAPDIISNAVSLGFVPQGIQGDYKKNITRAEFVYLCVMFIDYASPTPAEQLANATNKWSANFPDTRIEIEPGHYIYDPIINIAEKLGITSGNGTGNFGVNDTFDREQAAIMFRATFKTLNYSDVGIPVSTWVDRGEAQWLPEAIDFITKYKVTSGVGNNKYGPKQTMTREEAIAVFNKMAVNRMATEEPMFSAEEMEASLLDVTIKRGGREYSGFYVPDEIAFPLYTALFDTMRIYSDGEYLWVDCKRPVLAEGYGMTITVQLGAGDNEQIVAIPSTYEQQHVPIKLPEGVAKLEDELLAIHCNIFATVEETVKNPDGTTWIHGVIYAPEIHLSSPKGEGINPIKIWDFSISDGLGIRQEAFPYDVDFIDF